MLVGEAKWARTVDGARVVRELERKTESLPSVVDDLHYAVCARERVENAPSNTLEITAQDIFA